MSARLPRRRFIASVAGPVLASVARTRAARAQPENPVVVVGAGLAGLRAASLIREAGQRVIVLEARGAPGGRVRTLRAPFTHGLHGEAGAARFAHSHARVLRLVIESGLTLMPFATPSGAPLISTQLGRWRFPDGLKAAAAAFKLEPEEAGLAPGALLQRYVGPLPRELREPTTPTAEALQKWQAYDRVTWPDWLRSRGASPGAIRLMTLGGDSRQLSALYVLRQMALLGGSNEFYKIEGGMDRLVQALARRVAGDIRYSSPVTRVDQGPRTVAVGYLNAGRAVSLSASRVIFTNPFATLRQISVHPVLSASKGRVIAELPYYPATRILLQSKSRFWAADKLSGSARTDDPAEIWDAAHDQAGPAGLLSATVGRDLGAAPARESGAQALGRGVALVETAFPGLRGQYEHGAMVSWAQEPWSRGAFAVFHPGQMTAFASEIARAEDRIHFAGEHTSPWTGWMEGALESGERAAAEVLR